MVQCNNQEWLTPAEAAAYLGISRSRIYAIKNRLTHRKGHSPQARVFFLRETLFNDYLNV